MSDPEPGQETEPTSAPPEQEQTKGDADAAATSGGESAEPSKPSDDVSPPLITSGDGTQIGDEPSGMVPKTPDEPKAAEDDKKGGRQRKGKKNMQAEDHKINRERLKQLKEERRGQTDERHRYLWHKLADVVGTDENSVEDQLLSDDRWDYIEKFFAAGGSKALMFFYQDVARDPVPTMRLDAASTVITGAATKKLFITNGMQEPLLGLCMFFVRNSNQKEVTNQTIVNDVNFGMMDATNGSVLEALETYLSTTLIPALKASSPEAWGSLKNSKGTQVRDFLDSLDKFVGTLGAARTSLEGQIQLHEYEYTPIIDMLSTPTGYQDAAASSETTEKLETLLGQWCKQIETVLAESEQIRREADDVGPSAELEHWKKRMATFNSLLDQIKLTRCKSVVAALQYAKSRAVKRWRELDMRITDAANEAKDNVKYLYTLDQFFGPLGTCDPIKLTRCKSVVAALQYAKSRAVKRWRELDMRITDAANEAKDNVKYLYTLDKFFGPLGTCDPPFGPDQVDEVQIGGGSSAVCQV
ncbi:dynein axonemal heavy chain 5-like [Convolutriloba macropyga]|uniref:dynein axonemal heavy chain 5-like n=1 Tax=Convolutriloba macropyga TaxID=536237 RepID=UPI003F51D531